MSLSAAKKAPILAIDLANVEKYTSYHLDNLVLLLLHPVLPRVPKPCASSTNKRKLYFAS
jgi:hypothetical protein